MRYNEKSWGVLGVFGVDVDKQASVHHHTQPCRSVHVILTTD